jgi:hypothetical protein
MKRRLESWCELAASLGASQLQVSQSVKRRGLEPRSKGIAIVRSRYQATTSEDTAGWRKLSVR